MMPPVTRLGAPTPILATEAPAMMSHPFGDSQAPNGIAYPPVAGKSDQLTGDQQINGELVAGHARVEVRAGHDSARRGHLRHPLAAQLFAFEREYQGGGGAGEGAGRALAI